MIELLATAVSSASQLDWKHSQPGSAALIVVGVLTLAVAILMRSFLKHVRRAREPWDNDAS